ncbi:pectinesterase family protein [Micromonospora sp. SL1-18]|uniref:pectinesterase family protein n=1 Tax=Micromonospora sp. SL1-18 TaxID=3399128 RepID=UPI003A4E14F2
MAPARTLLATVAVLASVLSSPSVSHASAAGPASPSLAASSEAIHPRHAPDRLATPVCTDTPLRLTFDGPVELGTSGRLRVHRAGGEVVDTIDLADPATYQRAIGGARSDYGEIHRWTYEPVVVEGNVASVYLHDPLAPAQVYYVTIDPGFFVGDAGVTDRTAWQFRTKQDPRPDVDQLSVDGRGSGDFCTVQGAVDFVPEGNTRPVRIGVAPGFYREIVYVSQARPHISIRGAGAASTVIGYPNNNVLNGDSAMANVPPEQSYCPRRVLPQPDRYNCWRAAFGVDADDFRLTDLTVQNLTPYRGSQAEAFRGNGDRITLARVRLLSFQDTLRLQGRAFVTDSYIDGDVDFVWGTGGVFMQHSELKALHAGYYNQVRNTDNGPGNVFVDVRLTRGPEVPDDSVYLSRIELNRFPSSQVVFIDSAMDSHVKRVGWQITSPNDCAAAGQLRFWEYGSTDLGGQPLDTNARLSCSRQLTADEAARLRDPAYVLGWDPHVDEVHVDVREI